MTQASTPGAGYADAVRGWADHLRHGGTTSWPDWRRQALDQAPGGAPGQTPGPLPTSPHLETLRRVVELAGGPVPGLDERLLATSLPGRGRVDVPLPWGGPDGGIDGGPGGGRGPSRFGSAAVEPADVPVDELLRVALGLLVHLLPGVPSAAVPADPPPRWPLPGRPRFRVHGPPLAAATVRRDLLAAGWVESDWRPRHVVVGLPLDAMMAQHWDAETRRGVDLRWAPLWDRRARLGSLPGAVDVAATARHLRTTADPRARGASPVVVLGRDPADLRRRVATTFGLPAPPPATPTDPATEVDARACELRRRLNPLLPLVAARHPGRPARDLRHSLESVLEQAARDVVARRTTGAPDPRPTVPRAARAWAEDAATGLAEDLRTADYPVHGDAALVGELSSSTGASVTRTGEIDPDSTLELALVACLRAWRLQEGRD